jgi:hypothetical protein
VFAMSQTVASFRGHPVLMCSASFLRQGLTFGASFIWRTPMAI